MTIDEVIAVLTIRANSPFIRANQNTLDAIRLGIEVLKAVKECRASHMFCPGLIMQGETEQ